VETRQPCAVDRVQLAQENEVRVLTGAGSFSVRIIVDDRAGELVYAPARYRQGWALVAADRTIRLCRRVLFRG
jgi:hypothetical protein